MSSRCPLWIHKAAMSLFRSSSHARQFFTRSRNNADGAKRAAHGSSRFMLLPTANSISWGSAWTARRQMGVPQRGRAMRLSSTPPKGLGGEMLKLGNAPQIAVISATGQVVLYLAGEGAGRLGTYIAGLPDESRAEAAKDE